MRAVKNRRLGTHVALHHTRVANRVVVNARVPHLDKEADSAGEKSVVGVVEVVCLAALHKARRLAQVVRHACLNRDNLGSFASIASLKERLRKLHHLRGFDKLAGNKALHCAFANVAT